MHMQATRKRCPVCEAVIACPSVLPADQPACVAVPTPTLTRATWPCAEENGTRLYVACLVYFEDMPPTVVCQHAPLLGARASRTLCLVSHHPYLVRPHDNCLDVRPFAVPCTPLSPSTLWQRLL